MDREQFISNVKSSQGSLRRFLTALCCGDSQLADDIAQETFIKAWLSYEQLEKAQSFNAWIFRIAYTTFLNHRRSEKLTVGYDEARTATSDNRADESFRYQELYAALGRLSGNERTSVLLYYLEGYSVKEISAIEDVSADAVKQHLSRGRSHLRDLLGPK